MSPRTGRPIVGNEPKNKQIALRATETTVRKFQECADITGETKTDLLEKMVDELHGKLTKKQSVDAPQKSINALIREVSFREISYHGQEFLSIVFLKGELIMKDIEQVLNSREVSEMVEKNHNELLKDIRRYCKQFSLGKISQSDFFIESTYKTDRGKE